jgi:hypothetical protein
VFPVRYEQSFYIPEDGILHSHRSGNLKFYKVKLSPSQAVKAHTCVSSEVRTGFLYPRRWHSS